MGRRGRCRGGRGGGEETYRLRCASTPAMRVGRSTVSARASRSTLPCDVAAPALDIADVARVETGLLGEAHLREPALPTWRPDGKPEGITCRNDLAVIAR